MEKTLGTIQLTKEQRDLLAQHAGFDIAELKIIELTGWDATKVSPGALSMRMIVSHGGEHADW